MRAFRSVSGAAARLLRRILVHRGGAAAVEIALVAPVMLALVIGIVDFGRAFELRGEMDRAAGAAARALYLDPSLSTADIEAAVRAQLVNWDAARLTVAVTDLTVGTIDYAVIGVTYRFESVFEGVLTVPVDVHVETVALKLPVS